MQITYEYKIIDVDEDSRTMMVEYTSPERETVLTGVPIPFDGQEFEGVIKSYSPVAHWRELEKALNAPEVGTTGSVVEVPPADTGQVEVIL